MGVLIDTGVFIRWEREGGIIDFSKEKQKKRGRNGRNSIRVGQKNRLDPYNELRPLYDLPRRIGLCRGATRASWSPKSD